MLSEIDQLDESNRIKSLNISLSQSKDLCEGVSGEEVLTDSFVIADHQELTLDAKAVALPKPHEYVGEDGVDATRRLLQKLHHTQADLRAAELQASHMKLQLEAISSSEQQIRTERDLLEFSAAEAQQDKLLLETRLKEVAGFEGVSLSTAAEEVRGELLHLANGKINELLKVVAAYEEEKGVWTEKACAAQRLTLENQALREEVDLLGNHLAQRTVLYSAQERRLNESTRASHAVMDEKDTQISELRGRLQNLERRFESTDRERIEAIFSERQSKEACKAIEAELSNALERVQQQDTELASLNSQNVSLHATVQHLRGASFEDVERDLAADVENIRAEAVAREEQMRMQLDSARELLAQEAARRETILDEVAALRQQVLDRDELLRAVQRGGAGGTHHSAASVKAEIMGSQVLNGNGKDEAAADDDEELTEILAASPDTSAEREEQETDASVFAAMFDSGSASARGSPRIDGGASFYDDTAPKSLYGAQLSEAVLRVLSEVVSELAPSEDPDSSKSLLDALNSSDEAEASRHREELLRRLEVMIEQKYEETEEPFEGTLTSLSRRLVAVLGSLCKQYGAIETSFHQRLLNESFVLSKSGSEEPSLAPLSVTNSQSVTRGFLTGNDSDTDEVSVLTEELSCLKNELVKRKRRERQLGLALQQQRQQLAVVLERAASLPPIQKQELLQKEVASSGVQTLENTETQHHLKQEQEFIALETEREVLLQKVESYKEEISYLSAQVEASRQLGFHEAAEMHSGKTRDLEAQLQESTRKLQDALHSSSSAADHGNEVVQELATTKARLAALKEAHALSEQQHAESRSDLVGKHRVELNNTRVELQAHFDAQQKQAKAKHDQELAELYDMRSRISEEHAAELEQERAGLQEQMESVIQRLRDEHAAELVRATKIESETRLVTSSTDTDDLRPGPRVILSKGEIEVAERGMQTEFNVGDAQVDQRVDFALAHERLQGDNRRTHDLEMQRLTLEREHQLNLHDKIAALHSEYEAQLVATRQRVTAKYRGLLEKQRQEFQSLKTHLTKALVVDREGVSAVDPLPEDFSGLSTDATDNEPFESTSDTLLEVSEQSIEAPRTPPRSSKSAFDALIAIGPDEDDMNVSNSSTVTLSPPRWTDMSLGSITHTPVQGRIVRGSGKVRGESRRKSKEASPISINKGARVSSRTEQLSKPKKMIDLDSLRILRRFPVKI